MLVSCSGLNTLTPAMLNEAERKWNADKPASYGMVVSMEGDRVEKEEFDVEVVRGMVTTLRRNGELVKLNNAEDYSMDGLFTLIHNEMDLAKDPVNKFGAPAGYTAYLMARFDSGSGRLLHYRRAVGGINNSIDIEVLRFEKRLEPGK